MKKVIGILITVLVVAGMVFMLAGNRKKAAEQASKASNDNGTEMVTTCTASREAFARSFTSNGVVQPVSELNFVSEISGRVVAVYVDKGSRVAKGSPLLKIDSELLEADYKATKASYDALKKDEERFTRSYEAGGVTSQQLDNVRTQLIAAESRLAVSKWKLDNAVVKAPIAGTVNNRFVEPGALIAPNVPLFEIVNGSTLKVICNIPESRIGMVRTGQKVTLTENGSAGRTFSGTVRNIGVKTDRGLNYPVEVSLDRDSELRIGMYLKATFQTSADMDGILIPRKAVVGSVLAANVYVVADGKASIREVKLGDMYGENIEIVEGLEGGEEIVTGGLMNISDGTAVTVVNSR